MAMLKNLRHLNPKATAIGGGIGFATFTLYYVLAEIWPNNDLVNDLYLYGQMLAMAWVLYFGSQPKTLGRIFAYFYIFIFLGYFINDYFDLFFYNKTFIYPLIIMTAVCASLKLR